VTNIKTLFIATAISAGIAFAAPVATSQAMPAGPVKIQAAQDNNIVHAYYKKKKWREGRRWRHNRYWASNCDPWDGCYRRRHARFYRYYDYDEPYYGYGGYPYGYPYGGYGYGPGFYGPGIGLQFRIH